MRRSIWSDVLFTGAILAAAPALAHRIFGIRMEFGPLPNADLSWVSESFWWTLAAVLTIAGAVVGRYSLDNARRDEASRV